MQRAVLGWDRSRDTRARRLRRGRLLSSSARPACSFLALRGRRTRRAGRCSATQRRPARWPDLSSPRQRGSSALTRQGALPPRTCAPPAGGYAPPANGRRKEQHRLVRVHRFTEAQPDGHNPLLDRAALEFLGPPPLSAATTSGCRSRPTARGLAALRPSTLCFVVVDPRLQLGHASKEPRTDPCPEAQCERLAAALDDHPSGRWRSPRDLRPRRSRR